MGIFVLLFLDMVDIDLFKKILEKEDEGYITNGDFIPFELFDLLSKYSDEKRKKLFGKQPKVGKNYYTYNVEIKCPNCEKMFVKNMSKTPLFSLINCYKNECNKKDLFCEECFEKYELERKNEKLEEQKKEEEKNKERLKIYIHENLNPNYQWKEKTPLWKKMRDISDDVDRNVIAKYILSMPYREFLQTPYWKAISQKVMANANFRCQICNSNENLNVHHRTYEHHGYELYYMEDLICLCKNCHEKYHEI